MTNFFEKHAKTTEELNYEMKDMFSKYTITRNCIGSRFALMQVKTALYNVLLNLTFRPNEQTQIRNTIKIAKIIAGKF